MHPTEAVSEQGLFADKRQLSLTSVNFQVAVAELDRALADGCAPTPYALHPTPYTLHHTHFTPHATHYTLLPTHSTFHPPPSTLHPTHYALHPTPYTLNPAPHTLQPFISFHKTPASSPPTSASNTCNRVVIQQTFSVQFEKLRLMKLGLVRRCERTALLYGGLHGDDLDARLTGATRTHTHTHRHTCRETERERHRETETERETAKKT